MSKESRQHFEKFIKSDSLTETISSFRNAWEKEQGIPSTPKEFYTTLKENHSHIHKPELWKALDACWDIDEYKSQPLQNQHILIVGAGPAGLVTAIESLFLGAKPIIVEKRDEFTRHNVLLLWEYTVEYFKRIGAKALYPRLCVGSLYHVAIRRLQMVLTKIALLLGAQMYAGTSFVEMKSSAKGWYAVVNHQGNEEIFTLNDQEVTFTAVFGADGLNSHVADLFGFERKVVHAKQAIGITWNFLNHKTREETKAEEITYSRHMLREWFDKLKKETSIDLENCVYLGDETHYFICTAMKENLLSYGVLRNDSDSSDELLAKDNQDKEKLEDFAKKIARFAELPEDIEFTTDEKGDPDIQMFDFTQKQCAKEQIKIVSESGHSLLVCLVGDALIEPFWPQGTGANRAVLSAQDGLYCLCHHSAKNGEDVESISSKIYAKLCFSSCDAIKRASNTGDNDFRTCGLHPKSRYLTFA